MIRYRPTSISLGDEDLRYHLERLLLRYDNMAEWHQKALDHDSFSDDDLAFLGSDSFSPYDVSPPESFCSSGQDFPGQNSSQAGQDREGSPYGSSSLFDEPITSSSLRVPGRIQAMGTTGSSGAQGSGSASSAIARTVYESNNQMSWKECSRQSFSQLPGVRGVEWPQRHSLAGQPFITASIPSRLAQEFFWKDAGEGLSVSPSHSTSRPLHLCALELNRGSLLIGSGFTTSPLLLISTSQVHDGKQAAGDTETTLEIVEMAGGANKSTKKTRGQRASSSSMGSATVHHNGPVESSDTDIENISAAPVAGLQESTRPRPTEADEANPTRRMVSRGTQTEPVRLPPLQGHRGAIPRQALSGSRAVPVEKVHQRDHENDTRKKPRAREAPTISGLLRDIPTMAYVQRAQNASRANSVASIPSANPPVQGGIGSIADPHGEVRMLSRSLLRWPLLTPEQNRASIHPRLVEAREFQSYVNFMLDEVQENIEDGVEDIGSAMMFSTR
ncbi:uncharacterized protein BO80DRAFT_361964 [Aspergillus ibericus CBS 121593]|uniref:Uncharacterized protein n=1 Tax=Aspergillus ibericus CBS 121593 TaxID=1448316 RepID=A0A395GRV7_9EURO|nr:hypothetical protein BO80DRAFT_361964 [Aspergillus ibericus CBS 121593]RAK98301.1 hypothetical protein BO80DRAFT_361964 [Aspergillus ibericus CBS 121593]